MRPSKQVAAIRKKLRFYSIVYDMPLTKSVQTSLLDIDQEVGFKQDAYGLVEFCSGLPFINIPLYTFCTSTVLIL